MHKKTVNLPDAVKERLDRVAKEEHASQSEIVRRAIDRYIAEHDRCRHP